MSDDRFNPGALLGAHLSRRELLRRAGLTGAAAMSVPALAAALEACGGGSGGGNGSGGGSSSVAVFAIGREPKVLNPPVHTLSIESQVMAVIFPGLVQYDKTGTFVPDLAEDFKVAADGMTYTFTLRKGLKFDDGQPLTSKDWKFTWQAYVNPRTATIYLTGWDKIAAVDTPSDTSIVVHMKEPYAAFLLNVTGGAFLGGGTVLPQHVLQKDFDNLPKSSFNRQPVGCGPFRLKSWQTASQLTFEANPNYYRGRPKLDQLIFKIVPNANTALNELQTGEVDVVRVVPSQWDQVRKLSGVGTRAYDDTSYDMASLVQNDFLKDVKVRQALDYATPKQQYVTDILKGQGEVAYADVPPTSPYFDAGVEKHDYDLDKARTLLQEAGFTLQNGVMTKGGRPLEVPIYVIQTSATLTQFAQVMKERWTSIGVKTDVTAQESATLFGQDGPQYNGKDSAVIFNWGQGPDPDDDVNWDTSQIPADANAPGSNNGRYSNPQLDTLMRRGQVTADPTKRKQIYDQVQEILARDVPAVFLAWPKSLFGFNSKLQNFQPDAFRGYFWNVETWTKSG